MRHTRNYRPPFDAAADFITSKRIKVSGKWIEAHQPVDKDSVDARRLRQMFEQRLIQYAAGSGPRPAPAKPLAIGPTDLLRPGADGQPEGYVPPTDPAEREPLPVHRRSVPRRRSTRRAAA